MNLLTISFLAWNLIICAGIILLACGIGLWIKKRGDADHKQFVKMHESEYDFYLHELPTWHRQAN